MHRRALDPRSSPALRLAFPLLFMGTLAGCAASPVVEPPATVTVTAPAPDPDEAQKEDPAEAAGEPTEAATEPEAPAVEETFEMPTLVGVNLQLAQDTLQALDSYVLDQADASGLGRFQMNDSNWTVCAQDPASGAVVPISTIVTLASVKLDETCP